MANEEHLAILQQGIEGWQVWRKQNRHIKPDLCQANLQGIDLEGAYLEGVDFTRADLEGSSLAYTYLARANFQGANLFGVNFQRANLFGVNFQRANLCETNLKGADLTNAQVGFTLFSNMDLRGVQGLRGLIHRTASTIGIDTLYLSKGDIPERFLRGCGIPDSMIEYARALVAAERPIDYYSCFISYSSTDHALAERLYADLQAKGVRCWYAPHDLPIGAPILSGIDQAIRVHDKVLLILSSASVESGWVEKEVQMAIAREATERRRVLFPIRIDNTILKGHLGWPATVWDTINIGDFRHWKDHDTYQAAFTRLLKDLKAEQQ